MNQTEKYCLGIDFGTDSVRCLLVAASDGRVLREAARDYPRWNSGLYCDPAAKVFRQHPLDYIESLTDVVRQTLEEIDPGIRKNIGALSMATTGSTPVPVDRTGTPLALREAFKEEPDAMFYLWKDHSGIEEARDINRYNRTLTGQKYLDFVGGDYSSEWFWSKWLHLLRQRSPVSDACYCFVEHSDWMPFLLTGGSDVQEMKRNVCAAGHKGLWSATWQGYPPERFWVGVDPLLKGAEGRLSSARYLSTETAGQISPAWANRLGLPEDVWIGIGALDAHMGAVGGQIEPYFLSKVMGTSTCDMLVAPEAEVKDVLIDGICGQVPGSIIPGMIGMEAGQSAFGDVYGWLKTFVEKSLALLEVKTDTTKLLALLSDKAARLTAGQWAQLPLSTDWFNGRRSPDVQPLLKAAITGLDLSQDPVTVFASLVEATCFGSRAIVERFTDRSVPVKGIIGLGGIAHKSPFVMQTMASVLGRPIKTNRATECCALGAAMYAATQAGWYPELKAAMTAMGQGFLEPYLPDTRPEWKALFEDRYKRYQALGRFIEADA